MVTLEDCLSKKQIVIECDSLTIDYLGKSYVFNVGDKVERLTIVKLVYYKPSTSSKITRKGCICLCSCVNYKCPSSLRSLLDGDLKSCGCYCREIHSEMMAKNNYKHGFCVRSCREPLYTIWAAMKDRATNINRPDSIHYAKKGITICPEWKEDYISFRNWAYQNGYDEDQKLSIDRIDNSLGYSPNNCRWIKLSEQNSNKTNNRLLTYNGITKTITAWGNEQGLTWDTINRRLKNGLSVGQALGFEDI